MNLLQTKIDIETFINNNYTTTPIHWVGMSFDSSTYPEWVYVEVMSQQSGNTALSGDEESVNGIVRVASFTETPFRCTQLLDQFLTLMRNKKIGNAFIREVSISNQGRIDEIDKAFIDMEFRFEVLE